jgi:hypothetical protein
MASCGDILVHERRLPAAEVWSGLYLVQVSRKMFTSFSRLVWGHAVIKFMIVPFSIHSETIIKVSEDFVAPTNGKRFGCLSCFHRITSR